MTSTEPRQPATSDSDVLAIVQSHYNGAANRDNSKISFIRTEQFRMYQSEPVGSLEARDGESRYVTGDIRDAVEIALPEVMKVFFGGDEAVEYVPVNDQDEPKAREATEYMNWWLVTQGHGYHACRDWCKDALLYGIGFVKHWARDDITISTITREGATAEELAELMGKQDPDVQYEVVSAERRMTVQERPVVARTGQVVMGRVPVMTYDVTIRKTQKQTKIDLMPVPLDEILIQHRSRSFEDAEYFAHDTANFTRSQLLDMGYPYDLVAQVPQVGSQYARDQEERQRYKREDRGFDTAGTPTAGVGDWYAQHIRVTDHWVYTDFDGIGHSQWYWIKTGGDGAAMLIDFAPSTPPWDSFSCLQSIPIPHTVWSRGLAEWTKSYQEIRSVLMRQIINSIYRTNNPRPVIAKTLATNRTWDDVLSNELGAPIEAKDPAAVSYLQTETVPQSAFQLIAALTQEKMGGSTGTPNPKGSSDPNLLQKSKTAFEADIQQEKEQGPLELIISNYAQGGFKNMFRALLKLHHDYPNEQQMRRVTGEYIRVDPRAWNPEMTAVPNVGLGTANRRRHMAQMMSLGQTMKEMREGGMRIGEQNFYQWAKDTWRDVKNIDKYIPNPSELPPPPPPQPDPAMLLAQAEVQDKANDRYKIDSDNYLAMRKQVLESVDLALEKEQNDIKWAELAQEGEADRMQEQTKLLLGYADQETKRMQRQLPAPTVQGPGPERVQ